ncbi:peptidase M48 [Hylemonella gracilis]|jgi:predicted Zn-dependent protease|uniref:Peptidase M48 n=1 Tax=Hylemonella gracilis TaxID=80880 RepID=A0A4P6UIW5_9BURK|nr:M48 family metalloprotease [Hylemonella gracilis]QBK04017.1 peptidase M48 [Hylemonella gracilis]
MRFDGLKRKLLCLSLACSVGAMAQGSPNALPALGDGLEMSTGAERQLGDRIARELYRSSAYVDDAVLGDYVEGLWLRLMAAARLRGELRPEMDEQYAWTVLLGRDRSVNAFALPGGYMGVHLGLIASVDDADELASVLAHELSHITQRHIARMISRQGQQAPWMIAAMILGILAASSSPDAAGALIVGGQAATVQGQLNFSRDMEREADRVGYGVMTQAGFNGQGFASMFQKLLQANRHNDTGAFPYLRSHPLTTERIADMQARQQLQASSAQVADTDTAMAHAMLAARARVLADPSVDMLRAAVAQAEVQLPGTSVTDPPQPSARQAAVLYAAAWAAGELRDPMTAQKWWTRLQAMALARPQAAYQVRLLGAELALSAGDAPRALALLDLPVPTVAASEKIPRAQRLLRARALTMAGLDGAARAAQMLQVWLAEHPRDAQAWQLLSAACTAQGQTLRAVRADAEAYVVHFDYAAARDRYVAAQDLIRRGATSNDYIEASIIETRSKQVDALLREQMRER